MLVDGGASLVGPLRNSDPQTLSVAETLLCSMYAYYIFGGTFRKANQS